MNLDLGDTRLIIDTARKAGLYRNQLAYVLATAYWETANTMEPVEEAFWMSDAWRAKNLRYYPWHGRGYVQLTWERNYLRAGKALDVDLISDPDLARDPQIAAPILVTGMVEGWFTGKRLDQYITLQKSDYVGARRIVNGTDRAAQIADIARRYEAALLDAGYGVDVRPPAPKSTIITSTGGRDWLAALLAALKSIFGGKA
jgi:hypothetical protein